MSHTRCYCRCHQSQLADAGAAMQHGDMDGAIQLIQRAERLGPFYALPTDPVDAATACPSCQALHSPAPRSSSA